MGSDARPRLKSRNRELTAARVLRPLRARQAALFALWRALANSSAMALLSLYPTRKERAAYIDRRLEELYPHPAIPLDHRDAFTLMVAVLLSAQCTDKRVNQ